MSQVDAIFESMPVDEGSSSQADLAPKAESVKEMGDRVKKGDMNSRIEAFGEMLGDDEYGEKPKPHEPVKVEKDKTPVAAAKNREEIKEEDKKDQSEDEVDVEEESTEEIKEEAPKQELSKDTKIKVKVDGKEEEVTLEQLKSSYSHRQFLDRESAKINTEKKNFQKEKEQVLADGQRMQKEISELKGGFESVLSEYTKNGFVSKNPLVLVDQLLDRLGINSYSFNKAMFEHNLPEYARFFEMDEVQQDAYFAKKENEYLRKKDQAFEEKTKQSQAEIARQREEFNLIKQSGLSVDDFNSHFEELEGLGSDDLSVERVLEFARVKPIWDKAGEIVSKTVAAGDVDKIQQVSKILMEFPNTTEEEIIEHIGGKAAARDVSRRVKGKENFTVDTSRVARKSNDDEYTEEEMEMFRSIRRR